MKTAVKEYAKPVPRPYQVEAEDAFFEMGGDGIIQLFTGGGKTLLCARICDRLRDASGVHPGRSLFLAHTDELVRQTCRTMLRVGLWPSVEKADEYRGGPYLPDQRERRRLFPGGYPPNSWFQFGRVTVSSMQTFVTRMEKYEAEPFDLVVIDECQFARCATYHKIVDRMRAYNPQVRVLGLSATPGRADGKNLGVMLPKYFFRMKILDGIDEGYLVPIRCQKATAQGVDESMWKVGNTKHGRDITDGSLSRSMDNQVCIESIAHEIIDKGEGRKGIVFLPGIKVAESVTAALNELKPGIATFVHGKVPKEERKKRVRMHEDGDVKIMVGVMAMTAGYDVPDVSLVVLARMTKSRWLVEQKIGRGLRVLAESIAGKDTAAERRAGIAASAKKDLLILDFANSSRHNFATADDVLLSTDDPKMAEYVKKHRDPADKRALREQLEEQELMYLFEEALRKTGGPPKKENFSYEYVNLFGAGGYKKGSTQFKDDVARPSADLVALAYDLMVTADPQLSHNRLAHLVEQAKNRKCGRKAYGFLLNGCKISKEQISGLGINWHDAQYLRKLFNARPTKDLPDNWADLLAKHRKDRGHTNTGGAGR